MTQLEVSQGQAYTPFAAVNISIKSRRGRACRVILAATPSGPLALYDNPSAASGTLIWSSPAAAAAGDVYIVDVPCNNGIYLQSATGAAGIVTYS